jgi:hypothetical protein
VLVAKAAWLESAEANGHPIPVPRYRPAIYQIGAFSETSVASPSPEVP